jgi:hypothetical protein
MIHGILWLIIAFGAAFVAGIVVACVGLFFVARAKMRSMRRTYR